MDGNASSDRQPAVLLVEDNPDHAELISRCLDSEVTNGCLYHVSDGEEALNFLERRGGYRNENDSPRPALIFLDLRLPRLDGISLLRRIKSSQDLQSIPVVVLSSSTAGRDIRNAYAAKANAYLEKPLNFDEFKSHLQTAARFWLQCNIAPAPDNGR